jgi:hypothetical protein
MPDGSEIPVRDKVVPVPEQIELAPVIEPAGVPVHWDLAENGRETAKSSATPSERKMLMCFI